MNVKKILEHNRDNTELLRELAREVNAYDGSLDYLDVYEFDDDFFLTYFSDSPMDAARATYFGDIQSWSDEWIRFNGYGNLESLSDYAFEKELQESADDIIGRALEMHADGDIDLEQIITGLDLEGAE